jgi:hypothetical protein
MSQGLNEMMMMMLNVMCDVCRIVLQIYER